MFKYIITQQIIIYNFKTIYFVPCDRMRFQQQGITSRKCIINILIDYESVMLISTRSWSK